MIEISDDDKIIVKKYLLDSSEKSMMQYVKNGRKVPSRTFLIPVSVKDGYENLLKRYNDYVHQDTELKTRYVFSKNEQPYKYIITDKKVKYSFPIKDISDRSDLGCAAFLKKSAYSENRRNYDPENESFLRIRGYITAKQKMVLVVTLFEIGKYVYDIKSFFYKFVGKDNISNSSFEQLFFDASIENKYKADNEHFWRQNLINGYKLLVPEVNPTRDISKDFKLATYSLDFSEELVAKLKAFSCAHEVTVSNILFTCWGELLGRYNDIAELSIPIGGDKRNETLYFIRQSRHESIEKRIKDNTKRLELTYEFGACTSELFTAITGQPVEKAVYSQFFPIKNEYSSYFEYDESIVVSDVVPVESPLYLHAFYENDRIGINYVYDENQLDEEHVSSIHQWYSQIIDDLFGIAKGDFDKNTFFENGDSKEEKLFKILLAQKALYLSNSGIFENCSNNELMNIAKQCRLLNYGQDEECLSSGYASFGLYIIGDGKIEESRASVDGILKTIRIQKNNDVFGFECFDTDRLSKSTYYVFSKKASLVLIPYEVLNSYLTTHPNSWKHIMNILRDESEKIKKLWLTV